MTGNKDRTREQLQADMILMQRRIDELVELDSKRRQTEERLKEIEELLQALIDLAPDAYYLSDLKGTFIDGNKAAEEIIGYKKEELIGKSFLKLDLLSVKQISKAAELLARNAIGKATGPDEFILKRKDGSRVEVEISTVPLKMSKKTIVLGVVRDMNVNKELRESGDQLRLIFENINDAIISVDESGNIIAANSMNEAIFGYKPEDVIGKNFGSLGLFSPKDLPKVMQLFGMGIKGDVTSLLVLDANRKDGSKVKVEASTRIVRKGNKIESIIAVIRDITERK
ncbi:PAS domain-containing protein [Chloroflexota bacterium]